MEKLLTDIDTALREDDLRRAEIAIAKGLRNQTTAKERADLLFRRAQARLKNARPDDALEDVETCIALHPALESLPETQVLLGDIFFARFELAPVGFVDRSDTNLAQQHYQQVIELQPQHTQIAWVYYQLGRIYLSQDMIEEATAYFQKTLAANPDPTQIHALAYERLGFIKHFEERDSQIALDYFQKAREHYPSDGGAGWLVQLYIRISRANLELGKHEDALDAARRALRAIQDGANLSQRVALPEAHLAIAEVLRRMDSYEAEALEHYLRFLQSSKRPQGVDVTWSQVHETIGQISFRLERYQQAIDAYEKALEFNPYHPWEVHLRYQIARCHYRMRVFEKTIESIRQMQRAAQEDQQPLTDWRVFNLQGNAFFALENYEAAAEAYHKAIELAPNATSDLDKTRIYLRFSEELYQSKGAS